ncbi:potassium-transporting ATPase subunit KdpC [Paenibacillus sp. 1001270B_150601_E10]|uniref:potassium-transporting ATPase subunit KdpC n=1 Tax=Paenibacillus sp. 1001270B_150601_E10 TaxID=2787079 RepID=UPI00189D03F3|nr:potassium-transporting ATPase subunit KdpC [Paenibacillus sp. 1001270B_150601_E10]
MKIVTITLRVSLVFMLLCGVLYNLAVTGVSQAFMPFQANGSLIKNEQGELVGSKLIGQAFTDPGYFHGRISSIAYNGAGSGSPNYAPSSPDMLSRVKESMEQWKVENPQVPVEEVPVDLLTNSGSGLDPHISPESARVQIPRIEKETGITASDLTQMIERHTEGRELGFLGEPRVNVLELNLELQKVRAQS